VRAKQAEQALEDLCQVLVSIERHEDAYDFLKDLCTPQELAILSERWRVCRLLNQGDLSYRKIHELTGASLSTIGRVARFLKTEPFQGYKKMLQKGAQK
jgi:TrpR-related protein YerC/YecD